MKNLNNRSTSSPSLRGACKASDVAIQRRCSCHSERSEGSCRLSVISECLCRESAVRRCRSGFTLVELVIVIAIVIILSVVSVPIYRGYTRNAKMAEGYALLGTILSAQKSYYSQYGTFLFASYSSSKSLQPTCNEEILGIDARGNKYFTAFVVGRGDMNWYLKIHVIKPEDLRSDPSKNSLAIEYNVTKGPRYIDDYEYIPEA